MGHSLWGGGSKTQEKENEGGKNDNGSSSPNFLSVCSLYSLHEREYTGSKRERWLPCERVLYL